MTEKIQQEIEILKKEKRKKQDEASKLNREMALISRNIKKLQRQLREIED